MTEQKRSFGRRVNAWLDEAHGETFRDGKWRFWFPALIGFSILNAALTAVVFGTGGHLEQFMFGILLGVGALLAWLGVGALHYSDSHDPRLARGVSALDSVTLIFVIAHFCFLLFIYGRVSMLKSEETKYEASVTVYNEKAEKISSDNVRIAEAAQATAAINEKTEKLRNDTAYQMRKAVQAGRASGVRVAPLSAAAALSPSLSTAPIEMEKPKKPTRSSTGFLTTWDLWVRLANFGEILLAVITLIFIRNRSAKTNTVRPPAPGSDTRPREPETKQTADFPKEIDADVIQDDRTGRRMDRTRKSDSGRLSLISGDPAARTNALKVLRERLKQIAFYHPGLWFKADLIRGGVTIRLFKKEHGHEIMVTKTDQSDKLLVAVSRPDFRARLLDELIYQGFPLDKQKVIEGGVTTRRGRKGIQ
jgi:hypothetical protein